ncbi:hypothetical protein T10_6314 [Trichinella papuae]|uniref:Uncharacterized protein n=1 Tax=Trichinella papuae TaxID=268474 RepID=A0A0V1N3S8_9BILA|nr:hypothetical protein T10_6314 [Trichinella papuae]
MLRREIKMEDRPNASVEISGLSNAIERGALQLHLAFRVPKFAVPFLFSL